MKELFPGVFSEDGRLLVENPLPGFKPFSEDLVTIGKKEYRIWDHCRSKAAAAIMRGLNYFPIGPGFKILYHGAAHGYTCTFLSALVGGNGIIYAIEFSERCFNELLPICEKYKNMVPILADSRKTELFNWIEKVDMVYIDIAQPDEIEIFIRNCREFLKKDGYGMIAVKSRSIDVTKSPNVIYKEAIKKLESAGFEVIDWKTLDPFERAHAFIVVKFKS
jgi:fibrillarin-like pre-rRNA processing protein